MGRKSTRENKNIYQLSRENVNYTREVAAEKMGFVSEDRIEKIESEKTHPHPEEILAMAQAYKNPSLCNYFCSHECMIGQKQVPEVPLKELQAITLQLLSTLNNLVKEKDRLIEITVDGEITEDEVSDYLKIQKQLNNMSLAIESMRLWIDHKIADGNLDKELASEIRGK